MGSNDWALVELYRWEYGELPPQDGTAKPLHMTIACEAMAEALTNPDAPAVPSSFNTGQVLAFAGRKLDELQEQRDNLAEDSWSQLWQACGSDKDGKKTIDNMCMSTYEEACATFEGLGWLEEVNSRIYRVTKPGWD
jgi:hypothetical protein